MPDDFAVFSSNGQLLGNLTSNFGQIPNTLPALPSLTFPSTGSVVSQGGANSSSGATPTGAPLTVAALNAQNVNPTTQSGVVSGSIADYFLRGIIIVLGFIFVAIGLNMFKPGIVPDPRHAV